MSMFWIIFIIFILVAFFGGIIFLLWKLGQNRQSDVPPNSNMEIHFSTDTTNGHAIGVTIGADSKGTSERAIAEMKPLDLPYGKDGKLIPQQNRKYAYRREMSYTIPAGRWSMYRNITLHAPTSITDLDEGLRNHPIGIGLCMGFKVMDFQDKAIEIINRTRQSEESKKQLLEQEMDKMTHIYRAELERLAKNKVEPGMAK